MPSRVGRALNATVPPNLGRVAVVPARRRNRLRRPKRSARAPPLSVARRKALPLPTEPWTEDRPVTSADKTDHQEAGDAFAEMAQVAVSRQTESERRAAVTYAMLAIYHELRRNDLGAKIDALALEVRKIAALQGQSADIESGLARPSGS